MKLIFNLLCSIVLLMSCIENQENLVTSPSSTQSTSAIEDEIYQEILDMQKIRDEAILTKMAKYLKKRSISYGSTIFEADSAIINDSVNVKKPDIPGLNQENLVKCNDDTSNTQYVNFVNLNEQLNAVPALKKLLVIDKIKTCEEAHIFTEKIYEILESRPSKEMLRDNEKIANAPLSKTSIKNGLLANGPGLVRVNINYGASEGTGVMLSPNVVATAGHVIAGFGSEAYVQLAYFDPDLPTGDARSLPGDMNLILYPGYTSGTDAANDLGLIIKDTPWKSYNPEEFTTGSDYRKIYVGTMANARYTNIYGQGFSSFDGNISGYGDMRVGSEYINWYGSKHFYAYSNKNGGTRTCYGDSGGPWTRKNFPGEAVSGIHSHSKKHNGACADSETKMRACRLSDKVAWINQILNDYNQMQCYSDGEYAQCYAGEVNLALGRPTTVSSQYSSTFSGAKAVDGLYNSYLTKWNSAYGIPEPHWINIDLQQNRTISSYLIMHAQVVEWQYPQYNTRTWAVYSSTDNVNWSYRDLVMDNQDKITFRPLTSFIARYLHFYISDAGENYARIQEIEVY